jgi:CheY-like chemotaxis protein
MTKLLIIDDETYPLHVYMRALEREGFSVEHSADIDDALCHAAKTQYDVILLDIMMSPGQRYANADHQEGLRTGTLAYSDLTRVSPNARIIVVTNVTDADVRNELCEMSPKPMIVNKVDYPPIQLIQLIRDILGSKPMKEK